MNIGSRIGITLVGNLAPVRNRKRISNFLNTPRKMLVYKRDPPP